MLVKMKKDATFNSGFRFYPKDFRPIGYNNIRNTNTTHKLLIEYPEQILLRQILNEQQLISNSLLW